MGIKITHLIKVLFTVLLFNTIIGFGQKKIEEPMSSLEKLEPIIIKTFKKGSLGAYTDKQFDINSINSKKTTQKTITSPTQPGEVTIDKTATPVLGKTNLWDITLRIEGMDVTKTSDIVLVLDRSGSMGTTRMNNAKNAAIDFVNTLLVAGSTTRIALVSFGSSVTINQNFTDVNGKAALIASINSISSGGQTSTQAGMRQGQALLNGSSADIKSLVQLSDGVPTYSYALNNPDNYLIAYPAEGALQTSSLAPESAYNYSSNVGGNGNMWTRYQNNPGNSNDKYYNHGNSAIAEAGFAKILGTTVYTIAFEAPTEGTAVLDAMATTGKNYTATPANLNAIFQTIAGSIQSAAQNTSVSDPMGQGFTIPGNATNLVPSQGTATFDSNNNSIFWDVGDLINPIAPNSNIKFAELTYQLTITDVILNEVPNGNGEYPTNGNATISYTNSDGNSVGPIAFPVPYVDPVIVTIKKTLLNSSGQVITNANLLFDINFNSNFGSGSLTLNTTDTEVVISIQDEANYTFSEAGVSDNGSPASLSDYEITYKVDGIIGNSFPFFQNSADQTLEVINKFCALNIECPISFTESAQCVKPDAVNTVAELEALGIVFNSNCGTIIISSNDVSDNNTCPEIITRTYTILDDLNGNNIKDVGEKVLLVFKQ